MQKKKIHELEDKTIEIIKSEERWKKKIKEKQAETKGSVVHNQED